MIKYFKKRNLSVIDLLNLGFLFIIFTLALFSLPHNPYTFRPFLVLVFAFFLVWLAIRIRKKRKDKVSRSFIGRVTRIFLNFYPLIFFFVVFESFFMILPYLNPHDYDMQLAQFDYHLFGVDPTIWIEAYFRPWLTDLMYLLYLFYFPLPLFILVYLYRKGSEYQFDKSVFIFLVVYYGAYIMYFIIPAQGPRFYEPLMRLQTKDLNGLLISIPIRNIISVFEPNKFDAFPSLHTAISLTTIILMARYNKKMFIIFTPVVIGIWISLVYCRYHYVADMIAGIIWTVIAFLLSGWIYDKLAKYNLPPYFQKG